MAKDLRLTAIFAVRDQLSPVIQKLSGKWKGLRETLNSDNFKNLNKQFGYFRRSLTNVSDQVAGAAKKLALPFTLAAGAVGFSLSQMMSKFLSVGDGIDKASIRIGVSAERLQSLRYAANLSGASADTLDKSMAKLNENMAKAAAGKNEELASLFKKLGISLKDANGNLRNAADVMPQFADAIQRNTDAGLRARMMIAAFGEEGQKLVPMLEGGSGALQEMEDRAKRLGLVMSGDDVKAAAALGDRFSELGMVFDSFGNTLSAKIAPVLTPIIDDLVEFIAKNKEAFAGRVSQAVAQFAQAIKRIDFQALADGCMKAFDAIGRVFDAIGGFEMVLKAIGAILAGKVLLGLASFSGSLLTLGVSFAKLIPLVIKVGASFAGMLGPIGLIVAAVGTAAALIIANWDSIGPKVKEVWEKISGWASEKMQEIKAAFSAAVDNLVASWHNLCEQVKSLWASAGDWISEKIQAIKDAFSAAGDLIAGVWSVFCDQVKDLWDTVVGFYSEKLEILKGAFSSAVKVISSLFSGDLSQAFSSLGDMYSKLFDLLPESLKNVGKALFNQAGSILSDIGKMFSDFFSNLDLSALMPDSLKSTFGWIQSKLGIGGEAEASPAAAMAMASPSSGVPNRDVYSNTPVAATGGNMQGTMKIEVTATGGAQANVAEATSSDNLKIDGNVGGSGRFGGD
ncbi:hypothetical protein [uncultured Parasutterella sp.]|uniref:hypothetical protein n=1 Tax=uncultured Parasutterella sp. TaxID=1263098 RepID=UPI002592ED64|nr:hypothetical protein [uncultured Parasutterella sp.]